MAKHQQSLAIHQADYFRSAVSYQTDMQYWNTVARAEIVRVTTELSAIGCHLLQSIRERVEAGLVDPQDLLMAEVKRMKRNTNCCKQKEIWKQDVWH